MLSAKSWGPKSIIVYLCLLSSEALLHLLLLIHLSSMQRLSVNTPPCRQPPTVISELQLIHSVCILSHSVGVKNYFDAILFYPITTYCDSMYLVWCSVQLRAPNPSKVLLTPLLLASPPGRICNLGQEEECSVSLKG